MVYTHDLKSCAVRLASSSLAPGTKLEPTSKIYINILIKNHFLDIRAKWKNLKINKSE